VRVSAGARELSLAGRIVALLGSALLVTASGTIAGQSSRTDAHAEEPASADAVSLPPDAARLTIRPADGSSNVRPDLGVVVKVANGTLREVAVRSNGASVPGELSRDRKSWRTRWTLVPDRSYSVRATATSPQGRTTTASSGFTTQPASQTIAISDVTPNAGETVGVGMPITVTFNRAVHNHDWVERALEVRSTKPARGAWRWVSDQQVIFRTQKYWQPHQQITLTAHMAGVRAARDVYGTSDLTQRFKVGDANLSVVNVKTHRMVVNRNGKRARETGISAGRGGDWKFTTTNGVHAVMGKGDPVVMTSEWMGITDPADPEYYKLTVDDAVQISSSGEYVHSAPWSVWAQGNTNVSHGCVNASPAFAKWFYDLSQRGDIVTVTGTDRELEWNNGYGYWQMPWRQWLKGSAMKSPTINTKPAAPRPARQPLR
jgi:lipoprotein-anchoring transpeptidase ErfK/SrfK